MSTISRTLLDLAGVVGRRHLEKASHEAEVRGLLDMAEFEDVIERSNGRHGVRALVEAVREEHPLTRSELEDLFLAFVRRFSLPPPVMNGAVQIDGVHLELDAQWPRERLAVELDSWQFHRTRQRFESDRRRDALLTVRGWRVLRITWRRLRDEDITIATELRALLKGGAS